MDELLFQRASQTYLWAMPLINSMGMRVGSEEKFDAGYHILPVWKKRLSAKTLVTTPNSNVIYAMSYVDSARTARWSSTETPSCRASCSTSGSVRSPGRCSVARATWATWASSVPIRGKGGKFLLLPPGYNGTIPDGHFPYRSQTNNVIIFLRGFTRTRWT